MWGVEKWERIMRDEIEATCVVRRILRGEEVDRKVLSQFVSFVPAIQKHVVSNFPDVYSSEDVKQLLEGNYARMKGMKFKQTLFDLVKKAQALEGLPSLAQIEFGLKRKTLPEDSQCEDIHEYRTRLAVQKEYYLNAQQALVLAQMVFKGILDISSHGAVYPVHVYKEYLRLIVSEELHIEQTLVLLHEEQKSIVAPLGPKIIDVESNLVIHDTNGVRTLVDKRSTCMVFESQDDLVVNGMIVGVQQNWEVHHSCIEDGMRCDPKSCEYIDWERLLDYAYRVLDFGSSEGMPLKIVRHDFIDGTPGIRVTGSNLPKGLESPARFYYPFDKVPTIPKGDVYLPPSPTMRQIPVEFRDPKDDSVSVHDMIVYFMEDSDEVNTLATEHLGTEIKGMVIVIPKAKIHPILYEDLGIK
jgi:hypothetical protein